MEQIFDRTEIPFEELEKFGLEEEKILALPETEIMKLLCGERTTLLPIEYEGITGNYASIRLVRTPDGDVDFAVLPKLKSARLEQFDDEQIFLLHEGKIVKKPMPYPYYTGEGELKFNETMCFIQIDKQTNQISYTPTPGIARNLRFLSAEYSLSADEVRIILDGAPYTFNCKGKRYTIGINLNTRSGVCVYEGTEADYLYRIEKPVPQITFGTSGAWVVEDEGLRYYREADFPDYVREEQQARQNRVHQQEEDYQEEEQKRYSHTL